MIQSPQTSKTPAESATSRTAALWGTHSKMLARPSDRTRLQSFYRDVLGCEVGAGPQHPGGPEDTELLRFANGFTIVVQYTDSALADVDLKKAIWLELQTDNPGDLAKKIESFGIHAFDYFDKDHFYFQAPGGQVFRVALPDQPPPHGRSGK